jgi:hypothetical protein
METEAELLFRSGQLYLRRVGFVGPDGVLTFVGVKHGAVSVYWGDAPHLHFDLDGRWQRIFLEGTHYRKGLDGRTVALDRPRVDGRMQLERGELGGESVARLDAWAASRAGALAEAVRSGAVESVPPPAPAAGLDPVEAAGWLDLVSGWDARRWVEQSRLVRDAAHPWPALPPAGEGLLVVQATLGESGMVGTGGERPPEALRVRSVTGFADHLAAMRTIVGRRLAQYRGVYLAGPDALGQDPALVMEWLGAIGAAFPMGGEPPAPRRSAWAIDAAHLAGIEAGVRDAGALPTDVAIWRWYHDAGLIRVHQLDAAEGEDEPRALAAAREAGVGVIRTRRG